ncbi:MAG: hypothetical protein ACYS22_01860 [Planctomycetota bacterium]|jgi:hypothetical protein
MTDLTLGPAGDPGDATTIVTDKLARHLMLTGAGTGPVRVLVTAAPTAEATEVEAFFGGRATFAVQSPAPRLYEVRLLPEDVPELEARTDLFARLGPGTALFGKHVPEGGVTVTVDVAGGADVANAIEAVGGTLGRKGFGVVRATLSSEKLAALIGDERVEAIEVTALVG